MDKIIFAHSGDWEALRLTSRRFFPPNPEKEGTKSEEEFLPGGQSPRREVFMDVPQGIIIGRGSNRNGRKALMAQFGMRLPFGNPALMFFKEHQGQWNPNFNLWQIPLWSQTHESALNEALVLVQDALLELEWGCNSIEFFQRWNLPQGLDEGVEKFVSEMNAFYTSRECNFLEATDIVPVARRSRGDIERLAQSKKNRSLVNFLRHKGTAYEAKLAMVPYGADPDYKFMIFRRCNLAIAEAYPCLANEAHNQINKRNDKQQKVPSQFGAGAKVKEEKL